MSGKEVISRLKVPTLSFTSTPTPTKLLKAVDAIGLFQDEKLSAVSTSSSNNPFDETFRKALKESCPSNQNADPSIDDVLNTPQIINFTPSAPPSASVVSCSSKPSIDFRKLVILPKSDQSTSNKVVKADHQVCARPKGRKRRGKGAAQPTQSDIKERNKAAAKRSRLKKKIAASTMQKTIEQLTRANKELVQENGQLKKELSALKAELDQRRNMSSVVLVPNASQILTLKPS